MKIGILTLPLHTNYGGILQAYALQTIMQRMGYEVAIIHVRNWEQRNYGFRSKILSIIKKGLPHKIKKSQKRIFPFICKNLKIKSYECFSSIRRNDFDIIIVGSDQIWNKNFVPFIEDAFLSFAKEWNIKKIAYAVSLGSDKWNYSISQTEKCKDLAKRFSMISVREMSAINLCEKNLCVKASHVLDPTLLLQKDDYEYLISKNSSKGVAKAIIFSYFIVDTDKEREILSWIKDFYKYREVTISLKAPKLNKNIMLPSVDEWLQCIHDADFVFTDSFHCCIFSILFKKKFLVTNSGKGSTRLTSLLSSIGMERCIINENISEKLLLEKLNENIEPNDETILSIKKQQELSFSFLKNIC